MDSEAGRPGDDGPQRPFREALAGLIAFAEHRGRLSEPGEDGVPARKHLETLAERGNARAIAELEGPDYPDWLAYLWGWWVELSAGRGEGFSGAAPLTWEGLESWARQMDRHPKPHERMALLDLDRAFRHPPKQQEEEEKPQARGAPDWLPQSKR